MSGLDRIKVQVWHEIKTKIMPFPHCGICATNSSDLSHLSVELANCVLDKLVRFVLVPSDEVRTELKIITTRYYVERSVIINFH
jgi:hypothetical protein